MNERNKDSLRAAVRERYGQIAESTPSGCCAGSACGDAPAVDLNSLSQALGYSAAEVLAVFSPTVSLTSHPTSRRSSPKPIEC
ncbi:hypothetical protein [Allochromatium tepidum]|uniref:Uncharacterized protein n=1 Tax=Allochromatium tepidum TaxID=553982 RepID=A0ABM7QL24_9GAMM|nr:hypothetical protein [Allochromatium tepidum]BCU06407.1 hypothetical protein Atep_10840 [Allochromatium tepidum]